MSWLWVWYNKITRIIIHTHCDLKLTRKWKRTFVVSPKWFSHFKRDYFKCQILIDIFVQFQRHNIIPLCQLWKIMNLWLLDSTFLVPKHNPSTAGDLVKLTQKSRWEVKVAVFTCKTLEIEGKKREFSAKEPSSGAQIKAV